MPQSKPPQTPDKSINKNEMCHYGEILPKFCEKINFVKSTPHISNLYFGVLSMGTVAY